jgi:hypothetical protein
MEVHHHPDLHHERKKFREYLLECLMIFMAVTLGFFAETIREHISEKHREREYIIGLVNDLQNDTSSLKGIISRVDLELRGIDTLMTISKNHFTNTSVQDSLFFYALEYTFNLHTFEFNDLTLVQLRNAGGYSLIRTSKVADSIAAYESKNNEIKIEERFYIDAYIQTMAVFRQMFDQTLTDSFYQSRKLKNKIPADMDVLISRDQEKMKLLFNNYWSYNRVLLYYNLMLKDHLKYLNRFMVFLEQKYDLE